MDTFYTKSGKILGRAYALMECHDAKNKVDHKPHSHNPEYALYGPYMCSGYPAIKMYYTKPRKPVN